MHKGTASDITVSGITRNGNLRLRKWLYLNICRMSICSHDFSRLAEDLFRFMAGGSPSFDVLRVGKLVVEHGAEFPLLRFIAYATFAQRAASFAVGDAFEIMP